jgi:hypothetical protein
LTFGIRLAGALMLLRAPRVSGNPDARLEKTWRQ